jgi:hypothetical protein
LEPGRSIRSRSFVASPQGVFIGLVASSDIYSVNTVDNTGWALGLCGHQKHSSLLASGQKTGGSDRRPSRVRDDEPP